MYARYSYGARVSTVFFLWPISFCIGLLIISFHIFILIRSFISCYIGKLRPKNRHRTTTANKINLNELPPFCKCTLHTVQMSGFTLCSTNISSLSFACFCSFHRCVFVVIVSANSFFVTVVVQLKTVTEQSWCLCCL